MSMASSSDSGNVGLGVLYCLISFVFGIQANLVGPTVTLLAQQAQCVEADLAPVVGLGGLCILIGGMPSGWLINKLPGNQLLAGANVIMALGFALMPWCKSILQLMMVYGLICLNFNINNTGVNVLVIQIFSSNHQRLGFWLNLVSATFGLGGVVAPQIVTLSSTLFSSGAASYYVTAALSLAMACWAACTSNHKVASLADAEGIESRDGQPSASNGADGPQTVEKTDAPKSVPPLNQGTFRTAWMVLLPAMGLIFANVSIELGYGAWIYAYATKTAGLSELVGESMASLYWVAFTGGRLLAVVLAACMHANTILLTTTPAAILGPALLMLVPVQHTSAPRLLISLSVVLVGIGAAAGFPNTLAGAAQFTELDGFMNGVISTVAGLACTLFPAVVPWLAKHDPARGFGWLTIATLFMGLVQFGMLVAVILAGQHLRRRHQKQQRQAQGARDWGGARGEEQEHLRAPLLQYSHTDAC